MVLCGRLGFNVMFCLIIVTVNILPCNCLSKNRDDWVDPHDMRYYDRSTKSMIPKENIVGSYDSEYSPLQISAEPMRETSNFQYTSDSSIKEINHKFQCHERMVGNQCIHFLQRFINVFLRGLGLQNCKLNAGSSKQVTLELLLTAQELASLQRFGLQGDLSLVELDLILTNILTPSAGFTFGAFVSPVHSMADYILERPKLTILLSIATVLLFCIYLIERGRISSAIFILFVTIFISGFGFNWWRMYQEAIVDQMVTVTNHNELPLACRPKDWGWMSAVYYWFKGDIDCRQYFKSIEVDPFVKISPTLVMSETITMIFTHPLQKFGHAFGGAFNAFLSQLPLGSANPLNYILLVFLVIVTAVCMVCYLAILSGQRLRFGSFFSSIEMSPSPVQYGQGNNSPSHIEDVPGQQGLPASAGPKDVIANHLMAATAALQHLTDSTSGQGVAVNATRGIVNTTQQQEHVGRTGQDGGASGQDTRENVISQQQDCTRNVDDGPRRTTRGNIEVQQQPEQVCRMRHHPSFQYASHNQSVELAAHDGSGNCAIDSQKQFSPSNTPRKTYFTSFETTWEKYRPPSPEFKLFCCGTVKNDPDNKIVCINKLLEAKSNLRGGSGDSAVKNDVEKILLTTPKKTYFSNYEDVKEKYYRSVSVEQTSVCGSCVESQDTSSFIPSNQVTKRQCYRSRFLVNKSGRPIESQETTRTKNAVVEKHYDSTAKHHSSSSTAVNRLNISPQASPKKTYFPSLDDMKRKCHEPAKAYCGSAALPRRSLFPSNTEMKVEASGSQTTKQLSSSDISVDSIPQSALLKDVIANHLRNATTALQQLTAGSASSQDESGGRYVSLEHADQVCRMDHPSFQNLSEIENLEGGFQDGRGDCSFECEEPMSPAATARKSYFPNYKETKGKYGPQSSCDEEVLDNKIEYVTKAVETQPNVQLRKKLRLSSAVDSGEQKIKRLADGRVVSHRKLSI